MADQKFTPGPWEETNNTAEGMFHISSPSMEVIVAFVSDLLPPDEQDATARLIAKAPEMLDMLKGLEWSFVSEGDCQCPICHHYQDQHIHSPTCKLNAILKEIGNG